VQTQIVQLKFLISKA